MKSKKKAEVTVEPSLSNDYDAGITNYRVLAEKHNKSLKEVANYLKNKK